MNTETLTQLLALLATGQADDAPTEELAADLDRLQDSANAESYRDAMVMTRDDGFVLRVDGSEFQVTVVQSR